MTYTEAQALVRSVVRLVLVVGCLACTLLLVLHYLPVGRDSTDGAWPNRSGMQLRTDAATGCQYLEGSRGGITPRVGSNGLQAGCGRVPR